ncbi:MAG: NAD-dependent epimerase/dehydratase family protein [Sphingomonas sp.]
MRGQVLVTGGSGYIGGFVIRQLAAAGWTVNTTIRNLTREPEVRNTLAVPAAQLRFFAADLTRDDGWAEAMAGCTHVVHVASPLPLGAVKHEDDLIVPARDGALRAVTFAAQAGVQRVVLTSSVAAIAYGHEGRTTYSEADWTDLNGRHVNAYAKSKTLAERAARDWVAAHGGGMELCSVNPSAVFGPVLSDDFSGSIELVRRLIAGALPGLPNFGFGIVDVRDVAELHVRLLTAAGVDRERFIASGPFLMMHEIARILRERLGAEGRKVPTRRLPDFVLRAFGLFDPEVRFVVGELGQTRATPATHAFEVLGWEPRDAAATLEDTARSLIDMGIVKL